MSEIAKALGAAGPGWDLKAGGQTYQLTAATQFIKAQFEKWLKAQAVNEITGLRGDLDPDAYQELLAGLRDDLAAHRYRWGGPAWLAAVNNEHGIREMLRLLLCKHHPNLEDEDVDRIIEAEPKEIGMLLGEILGCAPNSRPPETQPGAN